MKNRTYCTLKNIALWGIMLTAPLSLFSIGNDTQPLDATTTPEQTEIVESTDNQPTQPIEQSYYTFLKSFAAPAATLGISSMLDLMSTYAHEHGHRLASGRPCAITVYTLDGLCWGGSCKPILTPEEKIKLLNNYDFSKDPGYLTMRLGGPLAGLFTIYLQNIVIELIEGAIDEKPWRQSLQKGLCYPFSLFSDSKNFFIKNISSTEEKACLKQPEVKSEWKMYAKSALCMLKVIQWMRFSSDLMQGLTPLNLSRERTEKLIDGSTRSYISNCDGLALWKGILGNHCPTIHPTIGLLLAMVTPFIIANPTAVWNGLKNVYHSLEAEFND